MNRDMVLRQPELALPRCICACPIGLEAVQLFENECIRHLVDEVSRNAELSFWTPCPQANERM